LYNIVSYRFECIFANRRTYQGDALDGLSTELFEFRLVKSVKLSDQELDGSLEIGDECLFYLLSTGRESGCRIFFDHRDTMLDEVTELFTASLKVRHDYLFGGVLEEIGQGSTSMGLNTRYFVIKSIEKGGKYRLMEGRLKVIRHIISYLTQSMSSCVLDLRIRVAKMVNKYWYHSGNLLRFVNIFSNLRKSHNSRIFIAPVLIIGYGVSH
jgi:hypothetical protein